MTTKWLWFITSTFIDILGDLCSLVTYYNKYSNSGLFLNELSCTPVDRFKLFLDLWGSVLNAQKFYWLAEFAGEINACEKSKQILFEMNLTFRQSTYQPGNGKLVFKQYVNTNFNATPKSNNHSDEIPLRGIFGASRIEMIYIQIACH